MSCDEWLRLMKIPLLKPSTAWSGYPGQRIAEPPRKCSSRRWTATRSVAEILCHGRSGEYHPKNGHGCKKNIPSGFAGRWQDVSVPANAPPFKHTKTNPRQSPLPSKIERINPNENSQTKQGPHGRRSRPLRGTTRGKRPTAPPGRSTRTTTTTVSPTASSTSSAATPTPPASHRCPAYLTVAVPSA